MTRDKIKEGDICTLDESVAYSYNPHKPYEVVVLWHGVNSQPLVTKLDEYNPFWTTYSQLIEVKRHIDLSIKALEQQTCEDCISREQAITSLKQGYFDSNLQSAKNDPCVIDAMIDWSIRHIKELPPVNPQHTEAEIQKMQELEQAEIQRAYELGKAEQQTDEDAVSREAALDAAINGADDWDGGYSPTREEYIKKAINALPPVNPQPKTGHWIEDEYEMKVWCSACGEENDKCSKYCPDCGAKMIEPQESEDKE